MLRLLCKPTSLRRLRSLGDLGRLAEYFSNQYESRFVDIRRKKNHTFIDVLQLTYSSSKSTVNYTFATCKL